MEPGSGQPRARQLGPSASGRSRCFIADANTCGCGELAAVDAVGPTLRFGGYNPDTECWTGSALFVCKPSVSTAPVLSLTDTDSGACTKVPGSCLDTYSEWNFWRFDLEVPMGDKQKRVDYEVEGAPQGGSFYVAGRDQAWHWGYYSCNGFTPDVPRGDVDAVWRGLQPLWRDVLERHAACPMHVLVGGGDQLYNDDVLKSPALAPFLESPAEARASWAWSRDMKRDVEAYYFHHYSVHFTYGLIGEALRSIPQIMTWDDHDIFDGWGSYPEHLQLCDVFQGMFRAARRFFLLFQLHTTVDLHRWHGVFGKKSYNQVVLLGPRIALALPDCRSRRTENQVLALDTHMNLIVKVDELPDSVTHLVVGTTVPVVYPHLLGGDAILSGMARLNKIGCFNALFRRTGIHDAVFNEMEEPELLDDLKDHWSSPNHKDERRFLIEHLQMLAKIKNLRVSLISGDVHLATTGRLYSWPKPDDLKRDFRFMPQIVSSAIANAPPPDGLVGALHLLGRAGFTNKNTRNKMCKLFDADGKHRLLNHRNWCEVWELDAAGECGPGTPLIAKHEPSELPGALVFSLRVETFDAKRGQTADSAEVRVHQTVAPVLERPLTSAAARLNGAPPKQDVYGKRAWSRRFGAKGKALQPGPAAATGAAAGARAQPPQTWAAGPEPLSGAGGAGGQEAAGEVVVMDIASAAAAAAAAADPAEASRESPSARDEAEEARFFKATVL
ncbi:MAG: hypothetical protein J3K34DRAFT_485023 [Monoraphidium minutum]|nr:MAG: hypothetical protein J3K34DRAFT_485023 [Monoraphidium minutum]